jgi:hypothetical protein
LKRTKRILGPIDRLSDPWDRSEESIRRTQRIINVHHGLLAAQYHGDNIEGIEDELVRRLREAYPEGSRPGGGSASLSMPVVAHQDPWHCTSDVLVLPREGARSESGRPAGARRAPTRTEQPRTCEALLWSRPRA